MFVNQYYRDLLYPHTVIKFLIYMYVIVPNHIHVHIKYTIPLLVHSLQCHMYNIHGVY